MQEIDLTGASKTAGKAVAKGGAWSLYALTVGPLVWTWNLTKLIGRASLWLVFWPLALMRSRKKHARRETDRIVAAIHSSRPLDK